MHDLGLIRAIRIIGSEKKLAGLLGVKQQSVNYWKNQGKAIPYNYVLEIERLTKGKITRFDLAPHERQLNRYIETVFLNERKISKTIKQGALWELKEKSGVKRKLSILIKSRNKKYFRNKLANRNKVEIAKKINFKKVKEYEMGKFIVNNGIPEIILMLDEGKIDIKNAYFIAKLSEKLQRKFVKS